VKRVWAPHVSFDCLSWGQQAGGPNPVLPVCFSLSTIHQLATLAVSLQLNPTLSPYLSGCSLSEMSSLFCVAVPEPVRAPHPGLARPQVQRKAGGGRGPGSGRPAPPGHALCAAAHQGPGAPSTLPPPTAIASTPARHCKKEVQGVLQDVHLFLVPKDALRAAGGRDWCHTFMSFFISYCSLSRVHCYRSSPTSPQDHHRPLLRAEPPSAGPVRRPLTLRRNAPSHGPCGAL